MATKITFERNAMMSAAHLTDTDDNGSAVVFCSIPGGKPWMQFPKSLSPNTVITVTNAPQCDDHKSFVKFVNERFGGES